MQQNTFQVSMKKFLRINFCFCDVIRDRNGEGIVVRFTKKNSKGQVKQSLELKE